MVRKIPISELKVGMRVVDMGQAWIERPFLFCEAGVITSDRQIKAIRDEGYLELFVEAPGADFGGQSQAEPAVATGPELAEAKALYAQSLRLARDIFRDAKLGRPVNHKEASLLIEAMVASVTNRPEAMASLIKLKTHDEYTFGHCVNVAVLVVIFGHYLGHGPGELHGLGLAGIYHDLGKTKVPTEILNKPGRLTEGEFRIIKRHPAYGADILESQGILNQEVLSTIRQHHEKYNGLGYPLGLKGDAKRLEAQMLSMADVYDALTSDRPYSKAALPNTAMRVMFNLRDMDLPADLIDKFIKCLGIYPVGSLVRLNNGAVAVICQGNTRDPLHPKVNIILDKNLRRRPHQTLDLSSPKVQAMGPGFDIAGPVDPGDLGLDRGVVLL
jgi:HD-GYP domain-containing protein (c-di-GMP phosphodiesterase class II)